MATQCFIANTTKLRGTQDIKVLRKFNDEHETTKFSMWFAFINHEVRVPIGKYHRTWIFFLWKVGVLGLVLFGERNPNEIVCGK